MMKRRNREYGQAGLEFVIITPVLLLAIVLLAVAGNQLYQKLSAQAFAYSHCMWEVVDVNIFPDAGSAFSLVVNDTKKTWNSEGLWENYPTDAESMSAFERKTCVGSVTHDEWSIVGSKYFPNYDPDVLVESRLTLSRAKFINTEPKFNLPNLGAWMKNGQ